LNLEILWKALIFVIIGLVGKLIVDHFKIEKLEKDLNGIGTRGRNAEWERWKMQITTLAEEDRKGTRRWLVEQWLKR
jgi:hypothetical protein